MFKRTEPSIFLRRQKDAEQKSIEDAANRRIEELVAQRVAEELERRKDEIEAEVLRRVEEAKKIMEQQMLEEIERRKQEQIEEARKREVRGAPCLRAGSFKSASIGWAEARVRYSRIHSIPRTRSNVSSPNQFYSFLPPKDF